MSPDIKLFMEKQLKIPKIINHLKGYSPSVQYYREQHVLLYMTQKQLTTYLDSHLLIAIIIKEEGAV